jgi:hypothetical protein
LVLVARVVAGSTVVGAAVVTDADETTGEAREIMADDDNAKLDGEAVEAGATALLDKTAGVDTAAAVVVLLLLLVVTAADELASVVAAMAEAEAEAEVEATPVDTPHE